MRGGRFPDHVSHWEHAISSEVQLLRSRLGLSRLAAGRPLTINQQQAAGTYLDRLRRWAREQSDVLSELAEKNSVAQLTSRAMQEDHLAAVMVLSELSTLSSVVDVLRLIGTPEEVAEMESYIEHLESGGGHADELAAKAVGSKKKADLTAWRAERAFVRLSSIEREINTVLTTAGLGKYLPKE
jgi:hypothetical protein